METSKNVKNIYDMTLEQQAEMTQELQKHGCERVVGREEYTLFKEVVIPENLTEDSSFSQVQNTENPLFFRREGGGVISGICSAVEVNDTISTTSNISPKKKLDFLAPLDVQKASSIAEVIPSFKAIQSKSLRLNIGFDTEFQVYRNGNSEKRRVLSLQMSIMIGDTLIRYFFLVDPRYQEVTEEGGKIPLKYCLADILKDLKRYYCPDVPLVRKENIVYKDDSSKDSSKRKKVDFKVMSDQVIPVTLVCHTGKADISVFRRSEYDVDLLRNLSEIQGGWMTTQDVRFKAENDRKYNYYWLISLSVRDTLGLTPEDNKTLKALGSIIGRPKIELSQGCIQNMASYMVNNPIGFYEYAMNDADIVIAFCSELFQCNHKIPMTLSSAAASSMRDSIKGYFGVTSKALLDRIYRGLELLDEGLVATKDEHRNYLKATRYVPLRDNPDARLISEFFEEAYTGGYNACFHPGWIKTKTTDFDLQNAYPTAMACIVDLDWSQPVCDFERDYELTLEDIESPLTPVVIIGNFTFPKDCLYPNIPVPAEDGMKIYPRKGENVYMAGPDIYLALKLGAKIKVSRGFICRPLMRDGKLSQCLACAVANLVQDRRRAKRIFKGNSLIEKCLKVMVCSCYGKIAQNVSPKTRYNAKKMGRVDAEPSSVTSPYHATYTTALVRCMLIACINQLSDMGYKVYSVTTDGFITDAPTEVVRKLDAFGFTQIFQNGRYILNQTKEECDANLVWEAKHYNETFLNITTRGNVAVNDSGVLAHNSYTTGEEKGSRADRDKFIVDVLSRKGRLECLTKVWTVFSEIVERKHDFHVTESIRHISMNYDYKRCPIIETAVDTPVHYESVDSLHSADTVIAEFDTRPFDDVEEFLKYRRVLENEDCVKVVADLKRVEIKATVKTKGYIGKDFERKALLSILMGYRSGKYEIPALAGLKQAEIVKVINSWNITEISLNDWKNCSRSDRQVNMLSYDLVKEMLHNILGFLI